MILTGKNYSQKKCIFLNRSFPVMIHMHKVTVIRQFLYDQFLPYSEQINRNFQRLNLKKLK